MGIYRVQIKILSFKFFFFNWANIFYILSNLEAVWVFFFLYVIYFYVFNFVCLFEIGLEG